MRAANNPSIIGGGARAALCGVIVLWASVAGAQAVEQRGFVQAEGTGFTETAPNDTRTEIYDVLAREEVFLRPASWIEFAGGVDVRANSHSQVDPTRRLDWQDRGVLRPRASLRRLSMGLSAGRFTLDVGKQFIRWGRADVTYPTDRFAPRDFLNFFDAEVLPVIGVRPSLRFGSETFEAVWVPQLTPSRLPLFDQRWTVIPEEAVGLPIVDGGSNIPRRYQYGARWRHTGDHVETAVSYFDGLNHLPNVDVHVRPDGSAIELTRTYPAIRMYGGDAVIPTGWLTWKLEGAYVTSPSHSTEEYVLYVVEVERQTGEWLLDVGYAGDVVTSPQSGLPFAPDRGVARSIIGHASYTIDPRRTVAVEGAVRQRGEGYYGKVDYSLTLGQHWRLTLSGGAIGGKEGDFLGQYRRNTNGSAALRVSF